MVNTKTAVLLIVASVLVASIAGIAVTQYASAQANGNGYAAGQTPQGTSGIYPVPQQGYYPYGAGQYGNAYGYHGMGMCGRFW